MEGIDTIPNTDADNALILGTALHTGIEEGVEQALDFYKNSFPVLTDDHIHEMMKLEAMIPKAKAMLPPGGSFELPIGNGDFIGFMDYLWPCGWDSRTNETLFDLYDFKYSNNAKNYTVSGQLHEYKYWYELTHPGHRIRNMYFLIVPKPKIRQKSTETLSQFRDRLQAALKDASNSSGNVTTTTDYLFDLSEFEVFGTRSYANQYEQNYQAQYDYYKAGNTKIANNHTAVTTAVWWGLRSPYYYTNYTFVIVWADGDNTNGSADNAGGLRPGFAA